jgi:AcrR family transcriptional regulator
MAEARARALPRGPHKLSREEVEHSQRQRLLAAATDAVAEKGYVATSVADILRRAGVSRTTFYRMFTDKQDCFLAAQQVNADTVAALMEAELAAVQADETQDRLARLDRVLGTYLDLLHGAPALARVFSSTSTRPVPRPSPSAAARSTGSSTSWPRRTAALTGSSAPTRSSASPPRSSSARSARW